MTKVESRPDRGTVGFEYRVPNGHDYGHQVASIYIPFEADLDGDPTVVRQNAAETLTAAKQLVFDALGVEYESKFDDDGTERAVALITKAFEGGVVVTNSGQSSESKPASAAPPAGKVKVLKPLQGTPAPDWLDGQWQALVDKGDVEADDNEVWDNRKFLPDFGGNGSDKAPWFRTKAGKAGIWPPKS